MKDAAFNAKGTEAGAPMEAVFPISVLPKEGEIFSSWATHVGLSHGITLNALIDYLYTDWPYKKRDIDKFANKQIVSKLALAVNVEINIATSTSLYLCVLPLFINLPYNVEWVTHVNNIYTKRRSYGLCFCQQCLEESGEGYFQLHWRFSFVTLCSKHRCLLLDQCQSCGSEISLYRLASVSTGLKLCYYCGFNLGRSAAIQSECFNSYFEKQEALLKLVDESHTASSERLQDIKNYFYSLYFFTHYVMHRYFAAYPKDEMLRYGSYEKHAYFDCYSVLNRLVILDLASSCYEDLSCNFKLHLQLAAEGKIKAFHKRTRPPCDNWCIEHDYLNIGGACQRLLQAHLNKRIFVQERKFKELRVFARNCTHLRKGGKHAC